MTTGNPTTELPRRGGPRLALLDERGQVLAASAPLGHLADEGRHLPLQVRATLRTAPTHGPDPRLVTARPRAPLGV